MICTDCATAADQRAGRDQHCTDAGCTCGHHADRYRRVTGYDVLAAQYARLAASADQTTEVHPRTAVRSVGEPFAIPPEARLRPARERPKLSGGPDAPPCKATIEGVGPYPASVHYCHLVAGHYDEADQPDFDANPTHPGGWHDDTLGGVWSDLAEGATPHADATEG